MMTVVMSVLFLVVFVGSFYAADVIYRSRYVHVKTSRRNLVSFALSAMCLIVVVLGLIVPLLYMWFCVNFRTSQVVSGELSFGRRVIVLTGTTVLVPLVLYIFFEMYYVLVALFAEKFLGAKVRHSF